MNSYIRDTMRHFWLIGLFVFLAQVSWAFVVSDTLIIDGETIYVEEEHAPVTDSIYRARQNDFKEKKKPVIWGLDGGFGIQITDFSISNQVSQNRVSTNEFLNIERKANYHTSYSLGTFFRVHKNIEVGVSFSGSKGNVTETSASVFPASNTLSFFNDEGQIHQIFQTEVQPGVFELDTATVAIFSQSYQLRTSQIPLRLRFYVNDFTVKSKWRAFGEISPVYRSFNLKSSSSNSTEMLFLNENGNFQYLGTPNIKWSQFGVLVGVGSEFQLMKKMNLFVQGTWNFPPINQKIETGAGYYTQYSNVFVGIRFLVGDGKN
ncbi:MAG: hypothetical protein RLZZ71_2077 [Bacteroidota bacterium]